MPGYPKDMDSQGTTIEPPPKRDVPQPAPDLMAALEQTLEELSRGGSGRWSDARERLEA